MQHPDLESLDDAELMRQFQGGDESAYELLVHRHLEFVRRHALRYVHDEPSAEDICQEVFVRLFRSADLFREPTNFLGWLATMTTRLSLNELRTRNRKRWLARSSIEADHPGLEWRPGHGDRRPAELVEGSSSEIEVERHERIAAVRAAIEQLPERQRLAIWLQRFEGWDLQRLGESLEMSIPAVKSLLHRARGSLSKLLEPYVRDGELNETSRPSEPPTGEIRGAEFRGAELGGQYSP